jgi:uncharacterized protein YbjT (DUF2867 family)
VTVLVTGATGHVGGRLAALLVANGVRVRALVRDPARAAAPSDVQISVGDYADPASLTAALRGVDRVFMVCLPEPAPGRLTKHDNLVEAARTAGVEHLVYLSFLRPSAFAGFPQARWHAHTEAAIDRAGLPGTFLRASLYQSSLLSTAGVLEGDLLLAPAGNGQVAAVAREDLAAVASAVLTSAPPAPGSAHAALDVTGPDLLTWQDIADAVAARTGRPVRYQEIGSEDFAARLRAAGRPEDLVEGMTGLFADIRAGHLAVRSDVVRRLSGRDALSFTRSVAGPP